MGIIMVAPYTIKSIQWWKALPLYSKWKWRCKHALDAAELWNEIVTGNSWMEVETKILLLANYQEINSSIKLFCLCIYCKVRNYNNVQTQIHYNYLFPRVQLLDFFSNSQIKYQQIKRYWKF